MRISCSTRVYFGTKTYTSGRKLEGWDADDELGPSAEAQDKSSKNSRVVVLKHMFTPKQIEEDASLILDLKEDVREECSQLGEVTNVVLYDVRSYCCLHGFFLLFSWLISLTDSGDFCSYRRNQRVS